MDVYGIYNEGVGFVNQLRTRAPTLYHCDTKKCRQWLPSGKRLYNDGKSPRLMGKSTVNGNFQ